MVNRRPSPSLNSARVFLEPGLWEHARLSWHLLRDARVAPVLKVIVPLVILLYLISPIDLIPDFLLGVGQLDDVGVFGAALLISIRLLPRLAPATVLSEHLQALGMVRTDPAPRSDHRGGGTVVDAGYRVRDIQDDRVWHSTNAESERGK